MNIENKIFATAIRTIAQNENEKKVSVPLGKLLDAISDETCSSWNPLNWPIALENSANIYSEKDINCLYIDDPLALGRHELEEDYESYGYSPGDKSKYQIYHINLLINPLKVHFKLLYIIMLFLFTGMCMYELLIV